MRKISIALIFICSFCVCVSVIGLFDSCSKSQRSSLNLSLAGVADSASCCDSAGTYVPVFGTTGSVTGPITEISPAHFTFMRSGDQVIVYGEAEVRGIALLAPAEFTISLPVHSNLTSLTDLVGTISFLQVSTPAIQSGIIQGSTFTDNAAITFYPSITGYARVFYHFMYTRK